MLPSTNRREAFGLVLLEGMAAGCVPVASDLPGVRDLARSNGLLVAPGDAQDLRWALQALAARPDTVRRLQAARDRGGRAALVGLRLRRVPRARRATGAFVTDALAQAVVTAPRPSRETSEPGREPASAEQSATGGLEVGSPARWRHWRACSSRSPSTRR